MRHTSLTRGASLASLALAGSLQKGRWLTHNESGPHSGTGMLVRLSWPAAPSVDHQLYKELRGLLAGPTDTVQVQPLLQTPRKQEDEEALSSARFGSTYTKIGKKKGCLEIPQSVNPGPHTAQGHTQKTQNLELNTYTHAFRVFPVAQWSRICL